MQITTRQKIYAVLIFFGVVAGASAVSAIRVSIMNSGFERRARDAEQRAAAADKAAEAAEGDAAESKARADFLEEQLGGLRSLAKKQNEELQKINNVSDSARAGAERRRGIRSVRSTADELCAKLAELGHACADQ